MVESLSSARIAALSREAGFDLCGFAPAHPLEPQFLVSWLEAGFDADMDWMKARLAERLDVSRLLPGAQTVVALACNHYMPDQGPSAIARYARGRDYHYTLRDRLKLLRRRLQELHPEVAVYASVDTAPVMEKVWASLAGLGYVGRHGLLITEKFGSHVLLATMVLNRAVDNYAKGSLEDRCGRCALCITSCPTGAIGDQRDVDARRCLSYQTIENRGPAPAHLRTAYEGIAFGCDICQDVCPLNSDPLRADDRFLPRAVAWLSIRELAELTPEAYQALVPGTPLARAKYDGLRRNAVYALGAGKDPSARPLLERLTEDASELVREAAQWALRQL